MPSLRKRNQKARKQQEAKRKRQKLVFSTVFILTLLISVSMLIVCAINKGPTLITTLVSGFAWLCFCALYAVAMKNKWYVLLDECTTGRPASFHFTKPEQERQKDNWNGNIFKFGLSLLILLIHLIVLFCL